jgi:hypothetical protein
MALHLTEQLKDAIGSDPSRCILWVGAGLSAAKVREGGKGLPSWDEFMQHMIEYLRDSDNCDDETLRKLEDLLKKGNHLEIAQVFKNRTTPAQLAAFVKKQISPPDITSSKIHDVILRIGFRGIITTNFDMVFERQNNRLVPLVYPQCLDNPAGFHEPGFFAKIHGCVCYSADLARDLVLTESSFTALRTNSKYQTILGSCFVMHPMLTVGYSLRDPDFLGLMADLAQVWPEGRLAVYALMLDPGRAARDTWRKRGVEIVPYTHHRELLPLFEELLNLSKKPPAPAIVPSSTLSQVDFSALLENWDRFKSLEEMHQALQDQIARLRTGDERENFLVRLFALLSDNEQITLAPHFVDQGTDVSNRVLLAIFKAAGDSDRWRLLKPHALHLKVHDWVLRNWQTFAAGHEAKCFSWLLDDTWEVDLRRTFKSILDDVLAHEDRKGLSELYGCCQHVPGAAEKIEKIVFAPAFIRDDPSKKPWWSNSDQSTRERIHFAKFDLETTRPINYKERLASATRSEEPLGEDAYRPYTRHVAQLCLEEFVQRTCLNLHGSSSLYNPAAAKQILEALAALKHTRQQLSVLYTIDRWPEEMRGHMSLADDVDSLREGLFVPLWWRYASETRIEYLKDRKHEMHTLVKRTGQDFLLHDIMGLAYDADKDFRAAFNASLEQHRSPDKSQEYEPRPLQEIWRERELQYEVSDEAPPELVRRIATTRADWKNSQPGEVRWKEARTQAAQLIQEGDFSQWVSIDRRDYAIDNLLGAYFPSKTRIVLYRRMIENAARVLALDPQSLSTVVYIHETVHAFSHVGRDRDGRAWLDYSLPSSDLPDYEPSKPHEALAQFYTYKLLTALGTEDLLRTFLKLETHCSEVYRAWRATEHYSLEDMRQVLVNYRKKAHAWPPPP